MSGLRRVRDLHVALARSLLLGVRRRRDVPAGAVPLPYARDARVTGLALLAAAVVEVVVVHLVVPWPGVRAALLVLGVYGVLSVLAWIADLAVRPHLVGEDALRLRAGSLADVVVPLDAVAAAGRHLGAAEGLVALADGELVLAVGPQTQLLVRLREPLPLRAGTRAGPVTRIRVTVDDPGAAVAAVTAALHRRAETAARHRPEASEQPSAGAAGPDVTGSGRPTRPR